MSQLWSFLLSLSTVFPVLSILVITLDKWFRVTIFIITKYVIPDKIHNSRVWFKKSFKISSVFVFGVYSIFPNRVDGNAAFTSGNHELAITLYTEAMKYAKVHETLWEGETMAIAAANRYTHYTGTLSYKYF